MAHEIEILSGLACSGKTTALLRIYSEQLRQAGQTGRPGRTLWLSPTFGVAEQTRRQLVELSGTALLAPQVLTFDGFAERLLQYAPKVMRGVPAVMQRVILRQIIDRRLNSGEITYFAGIASTSGFLDVVQGLIAELKREEIWPDQFQSACQQRGATHRDRELTLLYNDYQAQLLHHTRYDAEGRFWSARDQLEEGRWGPFPEFDLVVVDGFSDFTHTQYEILAHLSRRSQRMLLSLPGEAETQRPDLFSRSVQAAARLNRHVACRSITLDDSPRLHAEVPPAIASLSEQLFTNPRGREPQRDARGLEILAVTGTLGEVRAIAERVKRLLVSGVPARDIVVGFRPLTEYAHLVKEVFREASIPFHCGVQEPLLQQPVVKALLAVLQLELNDWSFERLNALLNSGWFRPRWKEWSAELTPRVVASILRKSRIPSGRISILGVFERLAASAVESADEHTPAKGQAVILAGQCLQRLDELLQPLRQSRTARGWADALAHIARELSIAPRARDTDLLDEHVKLGWTALADVLFIAAGTEELLQQQRRLDLATYYPELTHLLERQTMPAEQRQPGTVDVIEASQLRGLDVPYLFIGGLSESSFPQRGGDSFLYSDADRGDLNARGLSLGQRAEMTQAEMLLFYSIVTRARKTLTLSYPAVSSSGQPLSASPYLSSLRELFDPQSLKVTRIEQLDPVPDVESMLGAGDLRVVATSEALQKRAGLFQALIATPTGFQQGLQIRAAVEMSVQRFQTRGFTGYEGLLERPGNLQFLRERFSPLQEFSATQLEGYAQCPYRFWVTDVLKIRPAEAPDQFTDYGLRGNIVHEILVELHSRIIPRREPISTDQAVEVFRQLLQQRLEKEVASTDLLAALLRIETRLLEEWGSEYAQQWSAYHAELTDRLGGLLIPQHFEVSFGTPHSSEAETAVRPSLTLGRPGEETRIRGRIDRIDVGSIEGQTVFNIVDYKTGQKPNVSAKSVQRGHALQLVLYALATQRLELVGTNAIPLQAGYWCLQVTGWTPLAKAPVRGPGGYEVSEDWQALVDVLDELVPRLAAGIRQGLFPVFNSDSSCTEYCPYRTTCRVSQIRPLEDVLDKTWEP